MARASRLLHMRQVEREACYVSQRLVRKLRYFWLLQLRPPCKRVLQPPSRDPVFIKPKHFRRGLAEFKGKGMEKGDCNPAR